MATVRIVTGELVDSVLLDTDQLAHACNVQTQWVIERVEAGLLVHASTTLTVSSRRFDSAQLRRARQMAAVERDFEANPELAALVVDLMEEVRSLKRRLGEGGMG